MGIPARIGFSGEGPSSYKELVAEIGQLRRLFEANTAELSKLSERLAERDARIAELERQLSDRTLAGPTSFSSVAIA